MSKKRIAAPDCAALRVLVTEQLLAAAEEICWLLTERRHSGAEALRRLVSERLSAAAERIFTAYEAPETDRAGKRDDTNYRFIRANVLQ